MVRFEFVVRMNDKDFKNLSDAMTTLQHIAKNTSIFDDFRTQDLSAEEIFRLVVDILESEVVLDD